MQNIQEAVNLVRSGILVCYSEVNDTKETEMEFDIMDMTKLFEDFKNLAISDNEENLFLKMWNFLTVFGYLS